MAKLIKGGKMPDFTFSTIFEQEQKLSQAVGDGKTALIFLRYYGCTLCQYDIHQLKEHYNLVEAKGGKAFVVLQSDPVKLAQQVHKGDLPFDIICDPSMALYKEFEIHAAASKLKMAGFSTIAKIGKVKKAGFEHGEYEGEELQLPALFVVDKELNITYAHYAANVSDMPEMEELSKLL